MPAKLDVQKHTGCRSDYDTDVERAAANRPILRLVFWGSGSGTAAAVRVSGRRMSGLREDVHVVGTMHVGARRKKGREGHQVSERREYVRAVLSELDLSW